MNNDVLVAMRVMEWQKAKGHLHAMIATYLTDPDRDVVHGEFDEMCKLIREFTENVEFYF